MGSGVRWGSSSGGVDPEPEGLWHTWPPAKAEPETFGFKPFWHLLPSTKGKKNLFTFKAPYPKTIWPVSVSYCPLQYLNNKQRVHTTEYPEHAGQ